MRRDLARTGRRRLTGAPTPPPPPRWSTSPTRRVRRQNSGGMRVAGEGAPSERL